MQPVSADERVKIEEALREHGPETAKYLEWFYNERRNNGLLDVRWSIDNPNGASVEDIFRELNACHDAKPLPPDNAFARKPLWLTRWMRCRRFTYWALGVKG